MRLHSSVGRASHRYRGGHGFESRWSPDIFKLLLSNCLNWKFNWDDHSSLSLLFLLPSRSIIFLVFSFSSVTPLGAPSSILDLNLSLWASSLKKSSPKWGYLLPKMEKGWRVWEITLDQEIIKDGWGLLGSCGIIVKNVLSISGLLFEKRHRKKSVFLYIKTLVVHFAVRLGCRAKSIAWRSKLWQWSVPNAKKKEKTYWRYSKKYESQL